MAYYLFDGAKSLGPFEVPELLAQPGFSPASVVCLVGSTAADAWKPAASFPDIAALLKPAAPPPPPPPPPPVPAAAPVDRANITLSFPAPKPREPEPVAAAPESAPVAAAPAVEAADPFAAKLAAPSEKLILVVDDDDSVRSFIEMSAQMQGFQVVTATDGHNATAKLAARAPDLIITDLMMPGQSGYEFLRSLQAAGNGRIPVFVVTGSALDSSTVALIRQEANVVEFVGKPVNMAKFVAALHATLRTARKA